VKTTNRNEKFLLELFYFGKKPAETFSQIHFYKVESNF